MRNGKKAGTKAKTTGQGARASSKKVPSAPAKAAKKTPTAAGAAKTSGGAALADKLRARFEAHPERHRGIAWSSVEARLARAGARAMRALAAMEETGGEPDVIGVDKDGAVVFCDCAEETPAGRRSLCYDRAALEARKEHKPRTSALDAAADIGIEILDEEGYRALQKLGVFDARSSSWVKTPPDVRKLGGALFCDYRYGRVFVYHNGADSYYGARGFRGALRV